VAVCRAQDPDGLKIRLGVIEKELLAAQAEFGKKLPSMPEYKAAKEALDDLDAQLEAARKSKDEVKIDAAVRAKGMARKHLDEVIASLKAKFLAPANAKVAAARAAFEQASRENDLAKMRAEAAAVKIPKLPITDLKSGEIGRLVFPEGAFAPQLVAGETAKGKVLQVESNSELLVVFSWKQLGRELNNPSMTYPDLDLWL